MPDWNQKFKAEYDYAREWLAKTDAFAEGWRPLVRQLHSLMAADGFDADNAPSLAELRAKVTKGAGRNGRERVDEDQGILSAVGAWSANDACAVEAKAKMRAAALKFLRHVYLLKITGGKRLWVFSLPTEFKGWPSDDLNARANTQAATRVLLRSHWEVFSNTQKKYLANSTQQSLAWCHRAGIVLALAAKNDNKSSKSKAALDIVKRWFADPGTTESDLQGYVAKLAKGFKDIAATLNKGTFVLTDWVPLRSASTDAEVQWLNAEAFTFRSKAEGLDVVYIEKSFFVDHPGNVLKGQKNWTRIVVHELTHLVSGTEDIVNGKSRYAWYGIGPHAGFPGSQAIRNADSWAFFCADCAGTLTDGERTTALKII
ncbi:MAG TPA: M35 family metallo-endopeptidase [Vicinamibacterales bacterium]|jgi:hypothetical protein|nr:M35 family metallo-endopeptidase [Vicinamibacterales bacterium]